MPRKANALLTRFLTSARNAPLTGPGESGASSLRLSGAPHPNSFVTKFGSRQSKPNNFGFKLGTARTHPVFQISRRFQASDARRS